MFGEFVVDGIVLFTVVVVVDVTVSDFVVFSVTSVVETGSVSDVGFWLDCVPGKAVVNVVSVPVEGPRVDFVPDKVVVDAVSVVGPRLASVPVKVVVGLRLVPDKVVSVSVVGPGLNSVPVWVIADVFSVSDVGPRLDFVPDKVVVDAVSVFVVFPRLVPDKVVVNSVSVDWDLLVSDPFTVEEATVTVSVAVVGARLDPVSEDSVPVDCVGAIEDTATVVVNNRLDLVEVWDSFVDENELFVLATIDVVSSSDGIKDIDVAISFSISNVVEVKDERT